MRQDFLPISKDEMTRRGWKELDIILVTGDAYVDHPSYGASVIGRVLEDAGYRVGIIAQPDWRGLRDFKKLGRPRLFFGVTAGNLDSMVANYTANKKLRRNDDYSPGGVSGLRPDRATIMYTNKIREAFAGAVVVLGGLESSLRRLGHYDYWSDKVRRSVLLDSKADILVYGMGERQALHIAERLKAAGGVNTLNDIRGTVIVRNSLEGIGDYISLPSFEEIAGDKDKFNEAARIMYDQMDPFSAKTLVQRHGERFVIQLPPAYPLATEELDRIYGLKYSRMWHPVYNAQQGVPGFETVRFSVISHRGCPGACSFCSLYLHQGRIVQSRSPESIIGEIKEISHDKCFAGTISDLGGPTANLYKAECPRWKGEGACKNKNCLVPEKCRDLKLGYDETLKLWKDVMALPCLRHLFIGSGLRYDLLIDKASDEYLAELCAHHVGGQLKVAPEHSERSVLELMKKPAFDVYETFVRRFNEFAGRANKRLYLVNYFISGHPGAGLKDALNLAMRLIAKNMRPEQIQDFLPLPMTISGCMYHTGKDTFTGEPVYAAKGHRERKLQRALIQYYQPDNKKYIIEALRDLRKMNLAKHFFGPIKKEGGVNPRAAVFPHRRRPG